VKRIIKKTKGYNGKNYSKFNISHNYFENYEIISKKFHSSRNFQQYDGCMNFSNSSFWVLPIPISTLVLKKIKIDG
jgi:hypothetical protein